MPPKQNDGFYQLILDSISNLNDRVGDHSKDQKNNFYVLSNKIDEVKDQQNQDKEELLEKINEKVSVLKDLFMREHNALKTKVAIISAFVTVAGTIAISFIKSIFGGHQ